MVWNWPFCSTSPWQIYAGGVGSGSGSKVADALAEAVGLGRIFKVVDVDAEVEETVLDVFEVVDVGLERVVLVVIFELVEVEVEDEIVLEVWELVVVEVVLEVFEDEEEVVVTRHEQPDDTRDAGYCETYVGKGWFGGGSV